MTLIKRTILSSLAVLLVASMFTISVLAGGPYLRTEAYAYILTGPQSFQVQTSSYCQNGSCKYLLQESNPSNETIGEWGMGGVLNIYDWCAWIPSQIGKAAVQYKVWEWTGSTWHTWTTVVNQGNTSNWGKYVYLGYSDYPSNNTQKYVDLFNVCLPGWGCYSGSWRVYFDNIKYSTYPTRLQPSTCNP